MRLPPIRRKTRVLPAILVAVVGCGGKHQEGDAGIDVDEDAEDVEVSGDVAPDIFYDRLDDSPCSIPEYECNPVDGCGCNERFPICIDELNSLCMPSTRCRPGWSAGTIAVGEECVAASDCVPGARCLLDGRCHSWCITSGDCPGSGSCTLSAFEDAYEWCDHVPPMVYRLCTLP